MRGSSTSRSCGGALPALRRPSLGSFRKSRRHPKFLDDRSRSAPHRHDTIYVSTGGWGPATPRRLQQLLRGKSVAAALGNEELEARLCTIRPDAMPQLPRQDAVDRRERQVEIGPSDVQLEDREAGAAADVRESRPTRTTNFPSL